MANPRDFVPAKYKKPTTDKDNVVAASEVNSPTIVTPITPTNLATPDTQKTDSLWSGLASDETSKPLDNAIAISKQAMSADPNPTEQTDVIDTASPSEDSQSNIDIPSSGDTATPTKQFAKPKSKQNKLAGILVILFLVVGTMAGYFLMLQNQDGRQQASTAGQPHVPDANGNCPQGYSAFTIPSTGGKVCLVASMQGGGGEPPTSCGAGMTLVNNNQTNQAACVLTSLLGSGAGSPNAPGTDPVLCNGTRTGENAQGCAGWCWNGDQQNANSGTGVSGGHPCSGSDWGNLQQVIAGTYVWPPECADANPANDPSNCGRYAINNRDTITALVQYMANNPLIAIEANQNGSLMTTQVDEEGNQIPLELAPFKTCQYVTGLDDGYNTISCYSADCAYVADAQFTVNGTTFNQTRCYLTADAYNAEIAAGNTWSPYTTGCGDGIHDQMGQTYNGSSVEYIGDCNTWHFTTCLNQGTGVNGLGCDITPPNNPPNEPPNEPPSEPPTTTTPPPTGTPTPTPTLPPQLVCTDIEMLDASGSAMTGDDDQDLVDGDRVRFRSSASADDPDATFEFRILPPNTYAWIDITDTSATAAKDVSAFYTIVSSGHHVVQSRLCIDGVCQVWETNDENNVSDNLFISRGAMCQANPGTTPDSNLGTCDQRSDCPTDHYCGTDIVCQSDSDCSNGFVCYQPPMPPCPSGMSCNQRMPAKICADVDPTLITTTTR